MPCMRAASARPEVARVGQRKNGQCMVLDGSELGMNSLYVELVVEPFPLTQRHPSVPCEAWQDLFRLDRTYHRRTSDEYKVIEAEIPDVPKPRAR
jgi:hypothetical protein